MDRKFKDIHVLLHGVEIMVRRAISSSIKIYDNYIEYVERNLDLDSCDTINKILLPITRGVSIIID